MDPQQFTVLVVEDETLIAWDIADSLEMSGYAVAGPFQTLALGMEAARTRRFDAAVLDINLGAETVWPLADTLCAMGIPFVFNTADRAHPELAGRFSHVRVLRKPSAQGEMEAAVAGLLSQAVAVRAQA